MSGVRLCAYGARGRVQLVEIDPIHLGGRDSRQGSYDVEVFSRPPSLTRRSRRACQEAAGRLGRAGRGSPQTARRSDDSPADRPYTCTITSLPILSVQMAELPREHRPDAVGALLVAATYGVLPSRPAFRAEGGRPKFFASLKPH